VRQRAVLLGASLALLLGLEAVLLLRPDRRSAWGQATLSRDLPKENTPGQRGLWADQLRPLLREADALGAEPNDPAERQAWRQVQCAINQQLQELQRQFGRPVETAQQMGRPPRLRTVGGKAISAGLGMGRGRPERSVHIKLAGLLEGGQQVGVVEIEGFGPESLEPGAEPLGIEGGGAGGQVGGLV
jgi:hypothetical protein